MPIEFQPPALRHIITSAHAANRLKNREGEAYVVDPQSGAVLEGWNVEGRILTVYEAAQQYLEANPDHSIRIVEDVCNGTVFKERY